eukprot:m.80518 g.80518  ORF g.80518 m.80518 type:complete len:298 (+) comp50692_c0_seq1:94-987(+)
MAAMLRVGWVGVGVMGLSMAGHLLAAGYPLQVYTRTRAKAQSLIDKGAVWADNVSTLAAKSDIVFSIVGFPSDVKSVSEDVIASMSEGGIYVDMTTSEPSLATAIFESAKAKGIATIDAPVSGGDIGAKNATLSIMVGGESDAIGRVMPLFEKMGKNIRHMGAAGAGQHTKMVNQILIATNMIGVCEGLLYARKAGLDLDATIAAVGAGAAGSWSINNLGPRIVQRNFDPGFFVEHFIKDLGIALSECKRMGLSVPGLALAHQLYVAVQAQGYAKNGTHALMLALETLNGVPHEPRK